MKSLSQDFDMKEESGYMDSDLYQIIRPPNPLLAKNADIDEAPRSQIPITLLRETSGEEREGLQGSQSSSVPSSSLGCLTFASLCGERNNNVVYRRLEPSKKQFDNLNLLNLRKLLRKDEKTRLRTISMSDTVEPFYKPEEEDRTLIFESRFESGNLALAIKVSDTEYNLVLQNDINSKGHTQWFYFSVGNTYQGQRVRFNIINMGKGDSLFSAGMKVLINSQAENSLHRTGWFRGGDEISYAPNGIRRPYSSQCFATLSFAYTFMHGQDTVYFAYALPYTYTDLMADLRALEISCPDHFFRRQLCLTIGGNRCECLTITNPGKPEVIRQRKAIVLTARVHPGESVGSWVMKGVLEFLTSSSSLASALREHFVFKVIPMLNPDGVVNGNYRCGLAGCDLNRRWKNPSKALQPTIWHTKRMIRNLPNQVVMICDFHGHSRMKNIFAYGCEIPSDPAATRAFPYILSKISPFFNYKSCSFKMQKLKEATMRISMFKELRVPAIYTIEASFCGPSEGPHFTSVHLREMGHQFCQALLVHFNIQAVEINSEVSISRENAMEELKSNKELLESNNDDSSGSDSDPSEDNLDASDYAEIIPVNGKKSPSRKGRNSLSPKKGASIPSTGHRNSRKEVVKACKDCGSTEGNGHVCKRPAINVKPASTSGPPRISLKQNPFYYNLQGKKVRDQASQTDPVAVETPSTD